MRVTDTIHELNRQVATKPLTERPDLLLVNPEHVVALMSENPDMFKGVSESAVDGTCVMGYFLQVEESVSEVRLATAADYRAPTDLVKNRGQYLFTKHDPKTPICPDCWSQGVVVKLMFLAQVGTDKSFMCQRERKSKKFKGGLPPIGIIVHQ